MERDGQGTPGGDPPGPVRGAGGAYPRAVALRFEGRDCGYAALNARANRLARALVDRRIGPEQVVALAMPRSIDVIVAMLAVLKAAARCSPSTCRIRRPASPEC